MSVNNTITFSVVTDTLLPSPSPQTVSRERRQPHRAPTEPGSRAPRIAAHEICRPRHLGPMGLRPRMSAGRCSAPTRSRNAVTV